MDLDKNYKTEQVRFVAFVMLHTSHLPISRLCQLHEAVRQGDLAQVNRLLDDGADVNARFV